MHAPGVANIIQRQWRTMLKNTKAQSKVNFNSKLLKDERFGRFSKHRSMYALRRFSKLFKRWPLYEDRRSNRFERWTPWTQESPRQTGVKMRQIVSKCLKARQMCVDDEKCILKKTLPYLLHRTPNNAQNTQHKLGLRSRYENAIITLLVIIRSSNFKLLFIYQEHVYH